MRVVIIRAWFLYLPRTLIDEIESGIRALVEVPFSVSSALCHHAGISNGYPIGIGARAWEKNLTRDKKNVIAPTIAQLF